MQGDTKTLGRRFCMESTVVGLKYWYLYPDIVSRVFWFINYVIAYGMAGLLLVKLYDHFLDMPTRVIIVNQYESFDNMSFPAITLCSPVQLTTEGMAQVSKMLNSPPDDKLDLAIRSLFGITRSGLPISDEEAVEMDRLLNESHHTINDIVFMMPLKCEDFLKLCLFHGKVRDCGLLFRPILTFRGVCCAFNNMYHVADTHVYVTFARYVKTNIPRVIIQEARLIKNTIKSRFRRIGAEDTTIGLGLQIIIDYDFTKAMNKSITNAGISWIHINHWDEFPSQSQVLFVPGNAEALLCVHPTYTFCSADVKQLPYGSRKCYFQDEVELPHFGGYRNEDCDNLCLINAVQETCGCLLFYVPNAKPSEVCSFTSLSCIRWVKENIENWYNSSQCDCPRDCESTTYKVSYDIGNLNGVKYLVHKIPFPMKKTSSLIWLYMQRATYKKQKEETTISNISFIANLGGVFGLCLGCSTMTVLEVAFYIYSAIKNRMVANRAIYYAE